MPQSVCLVVENHAGKLCCAACEVHYEGISRKSGLCIFSGEGRGDCLHLIFIRYPAFAFRTYGYFSVEVVEVALLHFFQTVMINRSTFSAGCRYTVVYIIGLKYLRCGHGNNAHFETAKHNRIPLRYTGNHHI